MADPQAGLFIFSLDTELGTGYFDKDRERAQMFSPDGSRERWSIHTLLNLMDEYDIRATWAIVGHLFYERCEYCSICPLMDWKSKYRSFDEAYGSNHPLWYGADVVDEILRRGKHEIGFHGYSHKIFDAQSMTAEDARIEAEEWLRVASRKGVKAKSISFPRGSVAYLDVLGAFGFICYRSQKPASIWIRNRYFGRYLETLDHLTGISTPPRFGIDEIVPLQNEMIPIPASAHLFGFPRQFELFLDRQGLHLLRIQRIVNGIQRAVKEKKIFHLWAHPWEFRTDKDIEKIRLIFKAVAQLVRDGKMKVVTMGELAHEVKQYRSNHSPLAG